MNQCNTNPTRGESIKALGERDGSVDATSSYNNNNATLRALGQPRVRENSEGCKETYMTAQIGQSEYMMNDMCDEISPRGKNLEKMNVMNFISKKSGERFGSTDSEQKEYTSKNIQRHNSKKMIQGIMNYHQSNQGQHQFTQNKHPLSGMNMGSGGQIGYEYNINIPSKNVVGGESNSNHSSVVGHYQDMVMPGNNSSANFGSIGIGSNINVKKSMMKINNVTDIRDREMDMSPKGNEINFNNQNQAWKNKKY